MSSYDTLVSISIPSYKHKASPTPHLEYEIVTATRGGNFSALRRYNEFLELHDTLLGLSGRKFPASLPPKSIVTGLLSAFSLTAGTDVEARRDSLEGYLRNILLAGDPIWRDSSHFRTFLCAPVVPPKGKVQASLSPAAWMDEQSSLKATARTLQASLANSASSLASRLELKRKIRNFNDRLVVLVEALQIYSQADMDPAEQRRRTDLVFTLQDQGKMLTEILNATNSSVRSTPRVSLSAQFSEERSKLIVAPKVVSGRVLGQKAEETDVTRPLSDTGLFSLQQTQMDEQDQSLVVLTNMLRRQKELGLAISSEVEEQNELLDALTADVDTFGNKLSSANKQIRRLG